MRLYFFPHRPRNSALEWWMGIAIRNIIRERTVCGTPIVSYPNRLYGALYKTKPQMEANE